MAGATDASAAVRRSARSTGCDTGNGIPGSRAIPLASARGKPARVRAVLRTLALPARSARRAHHRPSHRRNGGDARREVSPAHGHAAFLPQAMGGARAILRHGFRSAVAVRELDISIPMGSRTPEWPGDRPFSCGWTMTLAGGGSVNLSAITTSPHVGTHADAPLHV